MRGGRFAEALRSGSRPLVLEITPPREPRWPVLLRRARLLAERPTLVDVIQRPDRVPSLEAALALRRAGIEAAWHAVTRGRGRGEIEAEIDRAAREGATTVLCVRGDHAAEDRPDTPRLREVVGCVRAAMPDALIGVTWNAYVAPEPALRNLLGKLRAGADFVQTQPLFSDAPLRRLAEALRARSLRPRLVAMAMPLLSLPVALRVEKRLGLPLPEELRVVLAAEDPSPAWALFGETLERLAASPWVDALAIMTPRMDPPPDFTARLAEALDRALPRAADR